MPARVIALVSAVAWAYAGVAAVLTNTPEFVGPAAAGFVACLFAAAVLEQGGDEAVQVERDVLHGSDLFPPPLITSDNEG